MSSYAAEAYRLWYEFLRRHEGYRSCCERGGTGQYASLYRKFGDVHELSFEQWQVEARDALQPPPRFLVDVLKEPEDFADYYWDDHALIVVVNLHENRRKIKTAFADVLRRYRKRAGQPTFDRDLSAFYSRPDVESLRKSLEVYDLHQHGVRPLWKLAMEAGIGNAENYPEPDADGYDDRKQSLASHASRHLKRANTIIKYVAKGMFPVTEE